MTLCLKSPLKFVLGFAFFSLFLGKPKKDFKNCSLQEQRSHAGLSHDGLTRAHANPFFGIFR